MKTIDQRTYEADFGIGPAIPDSEIAVYTYTVKKEWIEIKSRKSSLLRKPWLWLIILFIDWRTCSAPKNEPHGGLTDMLGFPKYQYKEFKGKVYLLGTQPSPGFPGN